MSVPRAITGVSKADSTFSYFSQPPPTLTVPAEHSTASPNALDFLKKIADIDIKYSLFPEELVTFTSSTKELGFYKVESKYGCYKGDDCILVKARSEGKVDDVVCSTEVTAYVTKNLQTIYQELREIIRLDQGALDRRTITEMVPEGFKVTKEIKQGDKTDTFQHVFESSIMEGYISEGANIILQRILIAKGLPEFFDVISFDSDTNVCLATYRDLSATDIKVGPEDTLVKCYGIDRKIHSVTNVPVSWHTYFLTDGHLVSRAQVGSPIMMKVKTLPELIKHDEYLQKPMIPRFDLNWQEDMQLYSMFTDKKEALMSEYKQYMRTHPELTALIADFLQALLVQKPVDTLSFAADFFATFSNRFVAHNSTQMYPKRQAGIPQVD